MASTKTSADGEVFMLLQECATLKKSTEKKSSKLKFKFGKKEETGCKWLPAGTLLREYSPKTSGQVAIYVQISGTDSKEYRISCSPQFIARLKHEEYELLAAIQNCSKRIEIFNDKSWLREGSELCNGESSPPSRSSALNHPRNNGNISDGRQDNGVASELQNLFGEKKKDKNEHASGTLDRFRSKSAENLLDDLPSPPRKNVLSPAKQKLVGKGRRPSLPCNGHTTSMENILGDEPQSNPAKLKLMGMGRRPSLPCTGHTLAGSRSTSMENILDEPRPGPAKPPLVGMGRRPSLPCTNHMLAGPSSASNLLDEEPKLGPARQQLVGMGRRPSLPCTSQTLAGSRSTSMENILGDEPQSNPARPQLVGMGRRPSLPCTGSMLATARSTSMENVLDGEPRPNPTKQQLVKARTGRRPSLPINNGSGVQSSSAKNNGFLSELQQSFRGKKKKDKTVLSNPSRSSSSRQQSRTGQQNTQPHHGVSRSQTPPGRNTAPQAVERHENSPPHPTPSPVTRHACPDYDPGGNWRDRRTSGPEEDDETPLLKLTFSYEPIDDDDDDDEDDEEEDVYMCPDSVEDNEPHYVNWTKSGGVEPVDDDPDVCLHDEDYANAPGQAETIAYYEGSDDEGETGSVPEGANGGEDTIYENFRDGVPVQVTNGDSECQANICKGISLPENLQEVNGADQAEAPRDSDDGYGSFSPQGFFNTPPDDMFAQCPEMLMEQEHHYEGIRFPVNPEDIFDQTYPFDPSEKYTGTCLIVDQFTQDRKGSFVDVRSIYEVFEKKFKFRVDYQRNLSKKGFIDTFKRHCDYMSKPANKVQRFVCFILGHGDEEGILTCVDGRGTRFHEEQGARIDIYKHLLPYLSAAKIPTMAGKPKLLFVQACRGYAFQGGHSLQTDANPGEDVAHQGVEDDDVIKPPKVTVPNEADVLVAYAQTSGNQAFRHEKLGSWFIQALTDIFRDYHERYDVLSMMTMVANAVSYLSRQNADGSEDKQSPIIQHTLRKKMFMLKAST